VVAADIDEQGAAAALAGAPGFSARLDVTSEADWEAAFRRIPRLDVFVHSAGISYAKPLTEMSLADWRRVTAVNLDGAFLGVRYAAEAMLQGGSMVLVASASGVKAASGASAYCASKAGLIMLAKAAALGLKSRGIRVNTVSPAGVATPMWKSMPFFHDLVRQHGSEEGAWKALGGIDPATPPLQRMAFPEEVAKVVAFLAGEGAANITGADIAVDAGYTA
jgi:2-keto-3-deoxy-L-fuconate dehydrogenase